MLMRYIVACLFAVWASVVFSQSVCPVDLCNNKLRGKEIYIPKDLQGMDLQDPESKWSYHRMCCTDNVVVFWEKGFGNENDEGKAMKFMISYYIGALGK